MVTSPPGTHTLENEIDTKRKNKQNKQTSKQAHKHNEIENGRQIPRTADGRDIKARLVQGVVLFASYK